MAPYDRKRVLDRSYTDAELDAALSAISDPQRLQAAQELVARSAPALQRVLTAALADGGWFDTGHEQAVREAAGQADERVRLAAVRTLIAEETRLGMLVGVAVGFELARELERSSARTPDADAFTPDSPTPQED